MKRETLSPEELESERAYYRDYYVQHRPVLLEQQRRRYQLGVRRTVKYHARQVEPPEYMEELTLP